MAEQTSLFVSSDMEALKAAIRLSTFCSPSLSAYSVGCIIADPRGKVLSTGYSRELGPGWHAEETAIHKAFEREVFVEGSTLYSTLEPCSTRASRSRSCTDIILNSGIVRVVYILREPDKFAHCQGHQLLEAGGICVEQYPKLSSGVYEVNGHILPDPGRRSLI